MRRTPFALIGVIVAALAAGPSAQVRAEVALRAAQEIETVKGDLKGAIAAYQKIVDGYRDNRGVRAEALLRMADCYQKLGDAQAKQILTRVIEDFGDQAAAVQTARARLSALESPDGGREKTPSARQVWASNHSRVGHPSPDGRWLPVVANGRLVLRNLASGAQRPFTSEPGYPTDVALFSPDGKRLLYQWREHGTDDWLLKIADIDGRGARMLHRTPLVADASHAGVRQPRPTAFSPDGAKAAFFGADGNERVIGLIDAESGDVTVLQRFSSCAPLTGNFSADGRFLVYSVVVDAKTQDREIRVIPLDGGESSVVVSGASARAALTPQFTPDGSRITYVSSRTAGVWDLWAVKVADGKATSAPEVLKASIGSGRGLGFTRDGTYFFIENVVKEDGYTVDVDPASGKVTGQPRRISERYVHSTMAPLWSPDGTQMAYAAVRDGRFAGSGDMVIVIRSLATGAERDFVVPYASRAAAGFYRWFPDGKSLLLPDMEAQRRKFRQLDLATGNTRLLFETGPGTGSRFRTWIEPDGSAVYFNAGQPGRLEWVRRDLRTGDERTIVTVNATSVNPSPDGRYITGIEKNAGPAFLADLKTGEVKPFWAPQNAAFEGGGAGWAPHSRGVYNSLATFGTSERLVNPENQLQELWYVPFEGEPRKSGLAMQNMFNLYVRPDGKQIGFSSRVTSSSVWSFHGLVPAPRKPS